MEPFFMYGLEKPYVENTWNYPLYIQNICVFKTSGTSLNWWDEYCEYKDKTLSTLWSRTEDTNYPNFLWDIWGIISQSYWDIWGIISQSYWDNILKISLKNNWITYENASFASRVDVRVSKPSIITLWGWSCFLNNTLNIANIMEVADDYYNASKIENKNFIWAWIWIWNISSYPKNITEVNSISKVISEWVGYNDNIIRNINNIWSSVSLTTTTNLSDFNSYNWLENVFILKDMNFQISWDIFNTLNWARTYIIENGNLIIAGDFNYSENIAFVVKWWDIVINNNVENITWIFVSIKNLGIGWQIKWSIPTTFNVLKVNWALYWDVTDLVSKRIYILPKAGQIHVWTIVNFGSDVFDKPSPLIWKFIWDYIESQKIAR